MASDIKQLEAKLWQASDELRANSSLKLSEFAEPVLGLIFLKFVNNKFLNITKDIEKETPKSNSGRQKQITKEHYHARGCIFVPEQAKYSWLLSLPENENIGKYLNDAMRKIEAENLNLIGVLPKSYSSLDNSAVLTLLKNFNQIPDNLPGDAFGQIYEYFLGNFALSEGQGGGEFFTPESIVKLIVEILEPYHGKIFDPACGSGGMFVQSLEFIQKRLEAKKKSLATREIAIYGQEKTDQTVRLAKMNLAIHGLSSDVKQGNTYYEDLHDCVGKFDFTMANPPFNVDNIDASKIQNDPRFPYGLPTTQRGNISNGNYIWAQIFLSSLSPKGRAGFVMANSASDAGNGEREIRKQMIEDGFVDVMISVGSNMFYNVTLPVTLWFFDKNKKKRKNRILFIDARNIFTQVDRAHRKWSDEQIKQIAEIVRSYREEEGAVAYKDIKGVCKVADLEEVRKADYSLNPGRYVGIVEKENNFEDFATSIKALNSSLESLTKESHELENEIKNNLKKII